MEKEKQIEEMALDIWQTGGIDLEIAGAIAIDLYEQGYRKVEQTKQEVAREIFEEIEKPINNFLNGNGYDWEMADKIAELKKKYIGE